MVQKSSRIFRILVESVQKALVVLDSACVVVTPVDNGLLLISKENN